MNLPIIQAIKGLRVGNYTKSICIIKKVFENEKFKDWVLYENIDQILPNKLHGPLHYKTGVKYCIQWTRVLIILWYNVDSLIHLFHNAIVHEMNPRVSMFVNSNWHVNWPLRKIRTENTEYIGDPSYCVFCWIWVLLKSCNDHECL